MKVRQTLNALWQGWKSVAHKIGDFQARLILTIFYFVVLAPFAMGVRIFSDPLQLKSRKGWLDRLNLDDNPENLSRKQS